MSRSWVNIFALEREGADESAGEHLLGMAYWDEARAQDEAQRRRCNVVAYQVDFDSNELRARFGDDAGRALRQREAAQMLEEIDMLRMRSWSETEKAAEARARVATIEVESGWKILAPWEDPHEGNMTANRYRMCVRTEHAQVQIIGALRAGDAPLEVRVTDADGNHGEPVENAGEWTRAIEWLAECMGAD